MVKIQLIDWEDNNSCGSGCCGDYGTKLLINEELITDYFQGTEEDVRMILEALNIEYEVDEM